MNDAEKLARFVEQQIPNFQYAVFPVQRHMGALIMDACIQAGLDYDTVVKPRVDTVANDPELSTAEGVMKNPERMLKAAVDHPQKKECIMQLASFFRQNRINTVIALRMKYWDIRNSLTNIKFINYKTRDYIGLLAGVSDVVAIDRYLRQFAGQAGIQVGKLSQSPSQSEYDRLFNTYVSAANLLGISPSQLDYAVWTYMNGDRISEIGGKINKTMKFIGDTFDVLSIIANFFKR